MTDTPEFLASRLMDEGEKVVSFFENLTADQWSSLVYSEGADWRIKEVLAHFVATEVGICALIENIQQGGTGVPEDFDLNRYNERKVEKLDAYDPAELIGQFQSLREKTAVFVAQLSLEDLNRQGRHPFLGIAPVAEIVKMMYRHNQIHLRDLRRILAP